MRYSANKLSYYIFKDKNGCKMKEKDSALLRGVFFSEMDVISSENCLALLKGCELERWIFIAAKVVSSWFPLEALE